MAIATGSMYKGFTFGGISSKDYGVYISGDGVFNAPEKDVEMISIPGRSGSFALDHGRWLNIELAYPAGLFGSDETDFAQAISDLRNALASKKGYQVLEDDYHPGEFRQAIYHSGLEVTPAQLKAGEFEIVFDCKPQRWLTAGQDPITVTSGDTINNPTLFDASPLLLVDGYGTIDLGDGGSVTVDNVPLGYTPISSRIIKAIEFDRIAGATSGIVIETSIEGAKLNTGDAFTIGADGFLYLHNGAYATNEGTITSATITEKYDPGPGVVQNGEARPVAGEGFASWSFSNVVTTYGTAVTTSGGWDVTIAGYKTANPSETFQNAVEISWQVRYDGANGLRLAVYISDPDDPFAGSFTAEIPELYGTSTKNATGYPLYIDLDIGEAYKEEGGQVISSNSAVQLGAKLAVLEPGNNTITVPSTVTSLQIVPRYWKL